MCRQETPEVKLYIQVKKEALWVISNATNKNSLKDCEILI